MTDRWKIKTYRKMTERCERKTYRKMTERWERKTYRKMTERWETESCIGGGDCGDYDYGDHYDIKHTSSFGNSIRTQATSKLTSPSPVQFVQGYRLKYVCRGFVQAQTCWRSEVRLVLTNV
jgi:hypothetical protein